MTLTLRHALVRHAMHPATAMVKFVVDFAKTGTPPAPDGRLDAPAFHRNHDAIWSAIAPFLGTQKGDVLELGSGTGQHAVTFARTKSFPIYARRNALISPFPTGIGRKAKTPAMTSQPYSASTCCTSHLGACRRISFMALDGCCARTAACSCTGHSCITVLTRRQATPYSTLLYERKIRNGEYATSVICGRSRTKLNYH